MKYQRTKNALMGLAIGDALSWQALFHRSYSLPFWTRRLRREIDEESESAGIIKPNLPFALNNPADPFKLSGTDDTEWAAFTVEVLIKENGNYNFSSHKNAWMDLAKGEEAVKGSVASIAAIANLKKGKMPPYSGNDNPHYFDDCGMVRAIPIGALYAGKVDKAVEFAGMEASITNSNDGVWAAQSIAAAISSACIDSDIPRIVAAALEPVPKNSWLSLKVTEALKIAKKYDHMLNALPVLYDEVIDHSYNYGSSAPDNLALTLALLVISKGDLTLGITSAASLAKTADSVPAFVGSICSALNSNPVEEEWTKRLTRINGVCIPSLKEKNYCVMAEKLNDFVNINSNP